MPTISTALAKKLGIVATPSNSKGVAKIKPALRGTPVPLLTFQLPWPPSVNHYYTVVVNARWPKGRKILSKLGRDYHAQVGKWLAKQGIGHHVTGKIKIVVTIHPEDRREFDLDNLWKPLLDSLQKAGLYTNDSQIFDERMVKRHTKSKRQVLVFLRGEVPSDLFKDQK